MVAFDGQQYTVVPHVLKPTATGKLANVNATLSFLAHRERIPRRVNRPQNTSPSAASLTLI